MSFNRNGKAKNKIGMDSRARSVFVQFTDYVHLWQVRRMVKKTQSDSWREKHKLKGKKRLAENINLKCVCVFFGREFVNDTDYTGK